MLSRNLSKKILYNNLQKRNFCYSPGREYFYYIDNKGLIYFEESDVRNITTCLKDTKFLKQFYSNIKLNNLGVNRDYRWYSVCWGEYNFLKCNKHPVVFSYLIEEENGKFFLEYNFVFKVKFDPANLFLDKETVQYQKINHRVLKYGVLSTQLMVTMSDMIEQNDEDSATLTWQGKEYKIPVLDVEEEFFNEK